MAGRHGQAGARVHLVAAAPPGTDSLPPLVLIHGASGNLLDFMTSVFPALAARGPVIAVDRPGFGGSDRPGRDGHRLAAQVASIRAALRARGHRRWLLLGHSYGSAVALAFAVAHPDEVLGLVSLSGPMLDWDGRLALRYRIGAVPPIGRLMGRIAARIGRGPVLARELAAVFAPQPVPEGYAVRAGVAQALRPATFALNLRQVNALHAETRALLPALARLRLPAEVIHGAADPLIPPSAAGPAACRMPEARLTVLPGIGHMPHHGAPEAVVAAVERLRARAGAAHGA